MPLKIIPINCGITNITATTGIINKNKPLATEESINDLNRLIIIPKNKRHIFAINSKNTIILLNKKLEFSNIVSVGVCVIVAAIVYFAVLFAIKTLSKEDVEGFPKGEKIAKLLQKLHLIR